MGPALRPPHRDAVDDLEHVYIIDDCFTAQFNPTVFPYQNDLRSFSVDGGILSQGDSVPVW